MRLYAIFFEKLHVSDKNNLPLTMTSSVNYLKSATIIQYTIKGRFMSR